MTNKQAIYVELLDEGTDVIRPVPAEPLGGNRYRLAALDAGTMEDEVWQFPPGSIVECDVEVWSGDSVLVARRRVG